jgi:DNA polymerase III subunit gamma/tau
MAYIPLHHKYRPQTFADLVGQEAISTTLTNALRLQKIAPAYLFTGPRGTGKTSSARILAKSLNCMASQVPTAQPCGKCDVCSSIALGAALDIIEIDAASNTGVDNIREIIERAQYAPVQCRYKVYIIDECHMLTTAAFNSLLKTLEEPPQHVVFVLATTDPQRVLPTIISRCQRFDYRRIPVDAMAGHLTYIATTEQIEIPAASVKLIAQIAQGGLRDAESLLDRLSLLSGEITPDRVYDAIGSVPERDLLEILQSIANNDPESLIDRTRTILERGKEPLIVLQNLAGCYRDLAISKTAPQRSDLVALTSETWTELVKIAQNWQLSWILAGQKHLKDSELQIKQTTQPQLWLEIALLGLLTLNTQLPPVPPISSPIHSIPPAPSGTQPPSQPPQVTITPPQPPSIVAPPTVAIDNSDIDSTWDRVLQQLLPASRDLFKPVWEVSVDF